MKNCNFEYYMNALHYSLYKGELWSNLKVERQVYKTVEVLSLLLFFKKNSKHELNNFIMIMNYKIIYMEKELACQ